jgi:hypothetical protein
MEPAGDVYFVRGHMPQTGKEFGGGQLIAEKLEAIWGLLPVQDECGDKAGQRDADIIMSRMELCYTAQDVERLEDEGRSRRGRSETMADAASLSQVLRCIGAYLNQKRARLCKITRDIDCLRIEYESSLGSKRTECFGANDLYDLWVRMYLQRSTRASQ